MDRLRELENTKYRNWVRGGLAYKYLKEGVELFADEVVKHEHNRILKNINHKPGDSCNQCNFGRLRPIHKSESDINTGKKVCPRGQSKCNCLCQGKKKCPNKLCDLILEDILTNHGSTPPMPNWKNTDMHKWCTEPWEIAKCFINAPGYSEKSAACEVDAAGLLHMFINNINLHSRVTSSAINIFREVLKRRNSIIHSVTMELEDHEVDACIDDIIAILEDDKELKKKHDAQLAVSKLRQLKRDILIITTHHESEVCRAAWTSLCRRSEKLKQIIQNTVDAMKNDDSDTIHDKAEKALDDVLDDLSRHKDGQSKTFSERFEQLKLEHAQIKTDMNIFKKEIQKEVHTIDDICNIQQEQIEYVERKQGLQNQLVERYQKHYVKTWICPLNVERNEIDINEVYVTPSMRLEGKRQFQPRNDRKESFHGNPNERRINSYHEIFHKNDSRCSRIVLVGDVGTGKSAFCKMMIRNWCRAVTDSNEEKTLNNKNEKPNMSNINKEDGNECADTRTLSISRLVPGKDTATDASPIDLSFVDDSDHGMSESSTSSSEGEDNSLDESEDIKEMKQFDFLFFIPLQTLSCENIDILEMIKSLFDDSNLEELIHKIFRNESERCLIIADGLDEWTRPDTTNQPPHVSYGLPKGDRTNKAAIIILSRPSAKGILNMKASEYDKKIIIEGVRKKSTTDFIANYMHKIEPKRFSKMTFNFCEQLGRAKLRNLVKTPLLLQHLIWMYCTEHEIGKSMSDVYSNIVNVFLGWSQNRDEREEENEGILEVPQEFKDLQLPNLLSRFPRCESNKRFLFVLGKLAFEALISEMSPNLFTRLDLKETGVSKEDVSALIKIGILIENRCLDPNYERTQLSFIHISYLEFFAAVFISSRFSPEIIYERKGRKTFVLENLFSGFKSTADILQMSNLLKVTCGLSPLLVKEMSRLISDVVTVDEAMIEYRNNLYRYKMNMLTTLQIQHLLYNCLSDCGSDSPPNVSLCDVVIESWTKLSFVQRIFPDSVLSLCIGNTFDFGLVPWMSQLDKLQYICIREVTIPHEQHELLSKSLFLKEIAFKDIKCEDCEIHINDLSKHKLLHSIYLEGCMHLLFPCGNPKILEVINISFRNSTEKVALQHKQYNRLLIILETAVCLNSLSLENISCDHEDCNGHSLNLRKHDQLCSLDIEDCVQLSVRNVNTTKLRELRIDNADVKNMRYVANAKHLVEFTVEGSRLDILFMESVIHTLQQLKKLYLINTSCGSSAFIVSANMQHLSHIKLDEVTMSFLTWCNFIKSLRNLPQSVLVETWSLDILQDREIAAREFVKNDEKVYQLILEDAFNFNFRTTKFRLIWLSRHM